MSEQIDNNLIHFIATTVETLRGRLDTISEQMATKEDLAALRDQMATQADPAAVKEDLFVLQGQMTTKDDLVRVELNFDAKTAAIRGDIEQVQSRLDSIDRGVGARTGLVESEISRLRRVVYLLVKDKPDMLRILG